MITSCWGYPITFCHFKIHLPDFAGHFYKLWNFWVARTHVCTHTHVYVSAQQWWWGCEGWIGCRVGVFEQPAVSRRRTWKPVKQQQGAPGWFWRRQLVSINRDKVAHVSFQRVFKKSKWPWSNLFLSQLWSTAADSLPSRLRRFHQAVAAHHVCKWRKPQKNGEEKLRGVGGDFPQWDH